MPSPYGPLRELLNKAYERNVSEGLVLSATAPDLGAVAFGEAARNNQKGALDDQRKTSLNELGSIANPETRKSFEVAFEQAKALFERISLDVPTTAELNASGIEFVNLGEAYERMAAKGLKPEIILAPAELTVDQAKTLYQNLQDDATILNNPLKEGGLGVSVAVRETWDSLNIPDSSTPTVETTDGGKWTLRIIPGTPRPTELNIDHSGKRENGTILPNLTHPTVFEYLTLQGVLIQRGDTPVDISISNWLKGTFHDGALAASGSYDSHMVCVTWDRVKMRSTMRGVRPTVG